MPDHPPALRTVEAPTLAASVRASVVVAEQALNESSEARGLIVVDRSHHLSIGPRTPCLERRRRVGPREKRCPRMKLAWLRYKGFMRELYSRRPVLGPLSVVLVGASLGVVLVVSTRVEEPHSRRQCRRDIEHRLTRGHQLLGQQRAEPTGCFDRPPPRRERLRELE